MNIKTIIFGCVAVGVATGGVILNNFQSDDQASYTPRFSEKTSHRASTDYLNYMSSIRANQITGTIDINDVNTVRQNVLNLSKQNNKASLGLTWANQGPDNVGGRTRALLIDNSNSNIVYAGSVAGGLYVSTDAAGTWTPIAEMSDNLTISCITQTANGRIFFGTGSTFESQSGSALGAPGFLGNGVYEYVPSSGQVLPVLINSGTIPNNSSSQNLTFINSIASRGDRLYVGTGKGMILADPDGNGDYPTTVTGWSNPIHLSQGNPGLQKGRVLDIDVATDGSMVVCFNSKVYHSFSDGDDTFTKTNVPGSRLSAAIAPSDPNYIYVVSTNGDLNNMYLSNSFDGSNKPEFAVIVPGGVPSEDPFLQNDGTGPQGSYDQCIAVDPNDKNHCLVGGIQLYEFRAISSTPGPGAWTKIAHKNQQAGPPYYMHADKHTFAWSGNTVYTGSDGGVTKSTDNGSTWSTKNLGYNTATFFGVSINALGWILGGSQDNGCQMVTFGAFGGGGSLSAIEIMGGDGFDTEMSNLEPGIAFTTLYYGSLQRIANNGSGGSLVTGDLVDENQGFFNTSINYWESRNDPLSLDSVKLKIDATGLVLKPGHIVHPGDTIFTGDTIIYQSLTNDIDLMHIVPNDIFLDATIDSLLLSDPIQHKMSYAVQTLNSVYMTLDASKLGSVSIDWHRIAGPTSIPSAFSGTANVMRFSPDGNALFVGSSNGSVYRVDNISMANDTLLDIRSVGAVTRCTRIGSFSGRAITGLAVDPNDANNVIVTLGNYGNANYIYRSTTALTTTNTTSFSSIQGPSSASAAGYLPRMPIYDAEIDFTDNNTVIIGTEWGVWASDNAFASSATSVQWTEENAGIGHVPVFEVEQQILRNRPTSGMYYLGTHGKGFFSTGDLVTGINHFGNEVADENTKFVSNLSIFPNPLNTYGNVAFKLKDNANTVIRIYNLTGTLVKTLNLGMINKGDHNERFDATNLSIGTYIIAIESGDERSVSKFIVTR